MTIVKSNLIQKLVGRLQADSLTPFAFFGSCCKEELFFQFEELRQKGVSLDDFASHPSLADLLIIAGPVNYKQIGLLQSTYEQMLDPKWVMVIGTCALSGAHFHSGIVSKNITEMIPVDMSVLGCPSTLDDLKLAFDDLKTKIRAGKIS